MTSLLSGLFLTNSSTESSREHYLCSTTPEKAQAFGAQARKFTGDVAFQQTVTVDVRTTDRYGRLER